MKAIKKIISIIMIFVLMISTCIFASAKSKKTDIGPIILVHGMMGWGENAQGDHPYTYWGMSEAKSLIKQYRAEGYEIYAPTVGPMSSAWDRACELYAQITGTVVDYGAAHSEKYGHSRWGRDYTGKGFLGSDWYKKEKINLVSHSFGGPAVTVFTSLMAYGSAEEKAASPNDCSPLFEGNHANAVFSVSTLESPHNGSTVANLLNDTFLPVVCIAAYMNIEGTKQNPATDFMLDQFGITCDPSTGKTASFNIFKIMKLATSKDHCAYDMSLQGARELCEKYQPSKSTYYFSVACNMMEKNSLGMILPGENSATLGGTGFLISILAGNNFHGIKTDEMWAYNDGLVPVQSALYPYSQPHADYDGKTTGNLKKGTWYTLPVVEGANHGYGVSGNNKEFWPEYFERITALKNAK